MSARYVSTLVHLCVCNRCTLLLYVQRGLSCSCSSGLLGQCESLKQRTSNRSTDSRAFLLYIRASLIPSGLGVCRIYKQRKMGKVRCLFIFLLLLSDISFVYAQSAHIQQKGIQKAVTETRPTRQLHFAFSSDPVKSNNCVSFLLYGLSGYSIS
jgi:hypothetical protein